MGFFSRVDWLAASLSLHVCSPQIPPPTSLPPPPENQALAVAAASSGTAEAQLGAVFEDLVIALESVAGVKGNPNKQMESDWGSRWEKSKVAFTVKAAKSEDGFPGLESTITLFTNRKVASHWPK